MTAGHVPDGQGAATTSAVVQIRNFGGPVNLAAWRSFVQGTLVRPATVTLSAYSSRPEGQRRAFDEARLRYHRGLSDIETRQMSEAHAEIDTLVNGNDGCPATARSGLIVNGLPFLGKSTIVLRWGSRFEQKLRAEGGYTWETRTSEGATFAPVVYVILSDGEGPKGLCQKIMRFFGEPYRDKWDEGELTSRIQDLTVACGTRVLLIDQMQNLQMRNRSARQTAAHLKELMDVLPTTMIGAGVQMERTGFFTEGHTPGEQELAQIGSRFRAYSIKANDIRTRQGRSDWESLLATVGDRLVLLSKRDGDLPALADYLHDRTGGVTGELMELLRLGANDAVGGTERITKSVLDRVRLSYRAQATTYADPHGLPDDAAAVLGRTVRRVNGMAR